METMPERINVVRTVSYDVQSVIKDLEEMEVEPIDLETVMNYITEWVDEVMRSPLSRHELTYLDQNGQEL